MRFVLLLLLVSTSAVGAESIHKCKNDKGVTVYQGQPCDGAAEVREIPAADKAARVSPAAVDAAKERMHRNVQASRIAYAEKNCIAEAESRIYGPVNARRVGYENRIARFERAASRAYNNAAGAAYLQSVRTEVAGLRNTIAIERQSADTMFAAERQRCAAERTKAEAAALSATPQPPASDTP